MSREEHDRLSTADLVAGTERHDAPMQPQVERQEQRTASQQQLQQPQQHEAMDQMQREEMRRDELQREPGQARMPHAMEPRGDELVALFPPEMAADFRGRWDQVQIGFVDDPRQAVRQADELVAQVMKSLATSFSDQRQRLEAGLGQGEQANTENLRMALRGYRSFFQRLLSL